MMVGFGMDSSNDKKGEPTGFGSPQDLVLNLFRDFRKVTYAIYFEWFIY
jgi:hypothetical protein